MADGVWRTVSGRRIFIEKGQDITEAMAKSGKFKNDPQALRQARLQKIKDEKQAKADKAKKEAKEYESLSEKGKVKKQIKDLKTKIEKYKEMAKVERAASDKYNKKTKAEGYNTVTAVRLEDRAKSTEHEIYKLEMKIERLEKKLK